MLKETVHKNRFHIVMRHRWVCILFLAPLLQFCSKGGADIEGCVVDVPANGFQCYRNDVKRFLPLDQGEDLECVAPSVLEDFLKACKQHHLECVAPSVLEDFLKACKQHQLLDVVVCQLNFSEKLFYCHDDQTGAAFPKMKLDDADNFFCVSPQDFKRIKQRCL